MNYNIAFVNNGESMRLETAENPNAWIESDLSGKGLVELRNQNGE